jgi:DNA-binding NarL/FixJ family response regulator
VADQPLVVVLGDSLLTEGVAVSLANCPQMSLIRIDSNAFDIWQQINALNPNVIVFDLEIPHSPLIFSLLKEKPGILLLGLDLECNRVIALNSRQHFTQTMHDLCQIVEAETGAAVRLSLSEKLAESLAFARPNAPPASSR